MKKRTKEGIQVPRTSITIERAETPEPIIQQQTETFSSPTPSKKRFLSPNKKALLQPSGEIYISEDNPEMETFEYTVIDTSAANSISQPGPSSTSIIDKIYRTKKRSKSLGKYIGTLMSEITDDKVFLQTELEVLKVIHESILKQNSN